MESLRITPSQIQDFVDTAKADNDLEALCLAWLVRVLEITVREKEGEFIASLEPSDGYSRVLKAVALANNNDKKENKMVDIAIKKLTKEETLTLLRIVGNSGRDRNQVRKELFLSLFNRFAFFK